MRILLKPLFLLSLALFVIDQVLEKKGIFIPFIHAYLDDICCMPVILSLASAAMSLVYFGKKSMQMVYALTAGQILFALLYCIILFEVLLPRYSAKYVSDFWDIPAYLLGAFVFAIFNKTKAIKTQV